MRNDVVSQYYIIEPEVAGGLGLNSNIDRTTFPPIVEKLHFVFEGWLGDPILESFPCFIVTDRLARKMEEAGLTLQKLTRNRKSSDGSCLKLGISQLIWRPLMMVGWLHPKKRLN